jgi:hypothetical protein
MLSFESDPVLDVLLKFFKDDLHQSVECSNRSLVNFDIVGLVNNLQQMLQADQACNWYLC